MDTNPSSHRKLALVTGASSGIGLELAKVFAQHGFDVLMTAEDGGLDDAAQQVRALDVSATPVQVDLTTPDGVQQLYERIRSLGRPVDVIAINAGVGVGGPFAETDLERELDLIRLNVLSTVHLAKLALHDMVARNEGRVLFTSSIAADMPAPFEAVYGASKAFVQSFAEALRNELKNTNITVTALQPGPTDTNFFRRADMEDTKVGAGKKDDPAKVARQAYDALMAGKDHIVAGSTKNKVEDTLAKLSPEKVAAQMHRKQSEPGSARE
jgi:short-subunit dehydrogenase